MATQTRGHGRANKDDSGMVTADAPNWPSLVFDKLREFDVCHVTYVPDSGHARLIELCHAANEMKPTVLTVEAAARIAFNGNLTAAVLLSQRMLGAKLFKD